MSSACLEECTISSRNRRRENNGFFDELGKKISVTGQNVMQKAKGMADITSLKSQINEEQKKIDKYCQNLGHMYYELKQNDPEPQLADWYGWFRQVIKELKQSVRRLRRLRALRLAQGVAQCWNREWRFV